METWIFMGKYILATALLMMLYWWALRRKASYRFNRHYLLLIPLLGLSMAIMHFDITTDNPTVHYALPNRPLAEVNKTLAGGPQPVENQKIESQKEVIEPSIDKESVKQETEKRKAENPKKNIKEEEPESPEAELKTVETLAVMSDEPLMAYIPFLAMGWGVLLQRGVVGVSGLLIVVWLYYIARMTWLKVKMKSEKTPEGYALTRSDRVVTPFSFGRTIFLPQGLSPESEEVIVRHEKAHIAHRHYLEIWVIELLARLSWFNPVVWLCRSELRNVHEFQADHDVVSRGVNRYRYQNTLLHMIINENSPVVSGFKQSFIRQRFIEMRNSSAGTLTRQGKMGVAIWVTLLFCAFGFHSCQISKADDGLPQPGDNLCAVMDYMPRLVKPQQFTLSFRLNEECDEKEIYIYRSDDFYHFYSNRAVDTIQVENHRAKYVTRIDHLVGGAWRSKGESQMHQLFFVPGEAVIVLKEGNSIRNNYSIRYDERLAQYAGEVRQLSRWTTPHLPQIEGFRWQNPESQSTAKYWDIHNNKSEDALFVKDVYFTDTATIVNVANCQAVQAYQFEVTVNGQKLTPFLQGADGRLYRFIRTLNDGENLDSRIFGTYGMFEPMPKDTRYFSIIGSGDINSLFDIKPSKHPELLASERVVSIKSRKQKKAEEKFQYKYISKAGGSDSVLYIYKEGTVSDKQFNAEIQELTGIQLWEGGPLFATTNLGAHKPNQYGDHNNWYVATKIAAEIGNGWVIPTIQDWQDLKEHCVMTWIPESKDHHGGMEVRGKGAYSELEIFLPAGGDGERDAIDIGQGGVYWTSNFDQDKGPCATVVHEGGMFLNGSMGDGLFQNPYKELSLRLIRRQ